MGSDTRADKARVRPACPPRVSAPDPLDRLEWRRYVTAPAGAGTRIPRSRSHIPPFVEHPMPPKPQTYDNHAKLVPVFHMVGSPLLLILVGWATWRVMSAPSVDSVMTLVLVVVLTLAYFYGRMFALGVQDRVIRLEERLRMERLLDADLQPRIPELTTEQLIGLRFASDEELPALVRRVLAEKIADRKTIKLAVRSWRADHQRI